MIKNLFLITLGVVVSFSAIAGRLQPMGCEYLYEDALYEGNFDNDIRRYDEISSSHAVFLNDVKKYIKYRLDVDFYNYGELCKKPIKMLYGILAHSEFKDNLQKSLNTQDELVEARKELNKFRHEFARVDISSNKELKKQKEFLEEKYKEKTEKLDSLPTMEEYSEFNEMMVYLKEHKKEFENVRAKKFKELYGKSKNIYEI